MWSWLVVGAVEVLHLQLLAAAVAVEVLRQSFKDMCQPLQR
jgi:hypothetical protein